MAELAASQWSIVFKQVFLFTENTRAMLRFIAEPPASLTTEAEIAAFRGSFKLRVINMDTKVEFTPVRFEPMTESFAINKSGYTVMVESCSEWQIPKVRWALVVLSRPDFPFAHPDDGPIASLDTVGVACEVSMPVQPKKYNVLFRYFIETEPGSHSLSIDWAVDRKTYPDMVLELEVIEDGKSVQKASGKVLLRCYDNADVVSRPV